MATDQKFEFGFPKMVIGNYIKICLYGRHNVPCWDGKFYMTIRPVVPFGVKLENIKFTELQQCIINYANTKINLIDGKNLVYNLTNITETHTAQ